MITWLSTTPTITAGAYSANDAVGGLLTFAPKRSILHTVSVVDKASQNAALTIVLYRGLPTATADNAALAPSDADMAAYAIGHVNITAADYATLGSNSLATKLNVGMELVPVSGDNIYAQIMTTGTPTYTSTSDLVVNIGVVQA